MRIARRICRDNVMLGILAICTSADIINEVLQRICRF